jgi:hypothetical protein
MTGTNHFLTGASIGLYISNPVVAIPTAFVSHFVLDALPHFGSPWDHELGRRVKPKLFASVIRVDALIAGAVLLFFVTQQLWLPAICMFAALSPDFIWVYRYVFKEQFGKLPPGPKGRLSQFHKDIQQYERHWGLLIEIVFGGVLTLITWGLL